MDISLPHTLHEPEEVVYRGSAAACLEYGLVLDAKGIGYRLAEADGAARLVVSEADIAEAIEELARYAAERTEPPEPPPVFVPFAGGITGVMVYAAVLISVAFFSVSQTFGSDWFAIGALNSELGMAAQWWRSITALTLHLDQEHLLGNLLFGAAVGILTARMFGPGVAWLSIVVCAAIANYADMLISPTTHRAIGASTAVFAGLGILAGFGWGGPRRFYRWGPLFGGVFLLAFLGAGGQQVDVLGHLFGFVTGLVAGFGYARAGVPFNRGKTLQLATGFMAMGLVLSAWLFAFRAAVRL